jgi:hypothetical protein
MTNWTIWRMSWSWQQRRHTWQRTLKRREACRQVLPPWETWSRQHSSSREAAAAQQAAAAAAA